MAEISIAYALVGPDGTRAVVGNCDEAIADPDFVGFLDAENGVSGLLDTADVRESISDLIEADGAVQGPNYLGRRSGTLQGIFMPDGTMDAVNAAEARLRRATRALRTDGVLSWTPTGESGARMLRFRRQGRVATTGRRPKAWQVALASVDPFVLSADEQSVVLDPATTPGEIGIADPILDPIDSPLDVVGQTYVVNQGNAPTWPRFRITGPITNPVLLNFSTGESIRFVATLTAADVMDVYPQFGAIAMNGADAYGALDFLASNWWQLRPGSNDIRILPSAYGAGALVSVYWRHAWE